MEQLCEIVHVITATQLIDSESYQRTLGPTHINCLRPGFYLVRWSSITAMSRYDEDAHFFGPFETRQSAELALEINLMPETVEESKGEGQSLLQSSGWCHESLNSGEVA